MTDSADSRKISALITRKGPFSREDNLRDEMFKLLLIGIGQKRFPTSSSAVIAHDALIACKST